ncbi:AAA family ATPase [Bdellovibrionota bacterium FG-1]
MAHSRSRSVSELYHKLIKASPILGIFGHRQVGKTTWMTQALPHYLTFDSHFERTRAESDPEAFLDTLKGHPFGIDECQGVPALFPALKERVRVKQQPGQFVLSGSVRFTSRKAIRESLAGRMMFFELYPLVLSEMDQRPLPDFFLQLLKQNSFESSRIEELSKGEISKRLKSVDSYLLKGGLPGICFLREERLRLERLNDLHHLILDRDLRMVHETRISIEKLYAYLKMIAHFGLSGYSYTKVKNELSLTPVTQKSLLYALESIFLIRRIPFYGGSKGEMIILEDQYEEWVLGDGSLSPDEQLLTLLYRNLRAQFHYRMGEPIRFSSYWTKNNARVHLVLKTANSVLGILAIEAEEPTLSQIRAAESLLRVESQSKVAIFSKSLKKTKVLNSRIAVIPLPMGI